MANENRPNRKEMQEMTAEVVAAFVRRNSVSDSELPGMIEAVYESIASIESAEARSTQMREQADSIRKSVSRDHLVCLEDGKRFKSMKRHLRAAHGMTPEQYRARWQLDSNYPMVAPSYAARRSRLARDLGFGKHSRRALEE